MIRRLAVLVLGVLALAGLPVGASAAGGLEISEATDVAFPDRAWVVTLPEPRALATGDVEVVENGAPVEDVRLDAGATSRSGVVLAIDASRSMRGQAIEDAMTAARQFAKSRRPEQLLGVVFFSDEATMALPPTTDEGRIAAALDDAPALSTGTQILDATQIAINSLHAADVAVGSVVVLSDGADTGSAADAASVTRAADDARVRIFSVGLQSPSFVSETLESIASDPDHYLEAGQSSDLAKILGRLGEQFGSEYVVRYRSLAPVDTRVDLSIAVVGAGVASTFYTAPGLSAVPGAGRPTESWWGSPEAGVVVGLVVALLLSLALFLVVRPRRRTIGERVASFVPEREQAPMPEFRRAETLGALERFERALDRRRRWSAYALDVELAKLKPTPMQLAVAALVGALLFALVAWVLGRTPIAIGGLIGIPIAVRMTVRFRANRVRKRFGEQLPDNLQVLASALRAGHSFVGALRVMVDDAPEPSRGEYRRVLTDEQLGIPIEDSMKVVAERMQNEEVGYVGLIATLQRETGGNTAEVLDRVTHTIRERMKLRRLVSTLTAQGRLGGWIVSALPVAMLVFLNITKPDYMDPMLDSAIGWVILGVAGLMVAGGAFVIRKIVDIEV